jgi:antiviral helicase SKI2
MEHDQWVIKENILAIRQLMSDQNLQLLPDYEQRIQVLRELGFIDEGSRVELKGKVACEVCLILQKHTAASLTSIDPLS